MNSQNEADVTLDDDIWKDSFDRLLNKRSLLRELNVLKSNVRISFNNDSSVEASKTNISKYSDQQENRPELNENKRLSASISTPILRQKVSGPFDCPLSPISSWKLTHFIDRNDWESYLREKSLQSKKVIHLSPHLISASTTNSVQINESKEIVANSSSPNHKQKSRSRLSQVENDDLANKIIREKLVNNNAILPPGKWRKSLIVWKRINHIKNEFPERCSNSYIISKSIRKQRETVYPEIKDGKRKLLKLCKQKSALSFSSIYSDSLMRKCRKIGEGTYGEVFMNSNENGDTVLKIIPIEGNININGEPQKSFEQILPEILITKELSELRIRSHFSTSGFVCLKNVRFIKGKYPDHLIELWNLYDKNYGSENDHPDVFNDDQLYVCLEIAYSGKDLEGFTLLNAEQAYSVFVQITLSLAIAEKSMQFEHRDLHCGNILLQSTKEKNIEYVIDNTKIQIPTNGIQVTIIDYTLSRMTLATICYYNDLSLDEDLFCAEGDYQYEIYKLMKQQLRNNWEVYDPKTNVMWLHYLLTKLVSHVKYKNSKSKKHLCNMDKLITLRDSILESSSAFECANKICKI